MIEFALGADDAAMGEHDVLGNGQPQPGAAGFAGTGLVYPVEALKQAGQVFGRNAGTEILHIKFDASGDGTSSQHNPPPGMSVFQRIVHQVRENLMDGLGIGSHLGGSVVFDFQFDILYPRDFAEALHRFLQQLGRRAGLDVETLLARFHPWPGSADPPSGATCARRSCG